MEKSSKRTREDRDRDHHKHRSRETDDKRSSRLDDTDHHRRRHRDSSSTKREKSYDSREDRESSRERERSRSVDFLEEREGSRDRSRDDNRTKYRDSSRRDRSYDLRDEREGSRERDDRHREKFYESRRVREESVERDDRTRSWQNSKREKSYDLRDAREESRERDDRMKYSEAPKHEKSYDLRDEREESRERDDRLKHHESSRREKSYGDGDGERNEPERWSKRKERERSEEEEEDRYIDEDRKRKRKLENANGSYKVEEKRERRKFEDKVKEEDGRVEEESGEKKREKRERRRFGDKAKEDDGRVEEDGDAGKVHSANVVNGGATAINGVTPEFSGMTLRTMPDFTPSHHFPTKVSSISNTNENKGVSITGSHEVPGKTSTDGTSSAAGQSASLSLDALAKAKKALQMQRELSEKLKKIPLLNKSASSIADGSKPTGPNEGALASSAISSKPLSAVTAPSTSALPTAAPSVNPSFAGVAAASGLPAVPNFEAVKRAQELAAKMGFRQDPQFAPLINLFPGQVAADMAIPQKPTKAPVLRLDALGREIDEHGNVVNVTKPSNLSTLKVNINKQKKEAFQILKPDLDIDPESNPHFDPRMGINKTKLLRPKKMSFQFVEEGKWSKEAEMMKLKSQFGEARAKEQKAKQAQLAKAKSAPDINPNLIEVSERVPVREKSKETIPEVEWWDVPLLHSGNYEGAVDGLIPDDKLKMDKITIYVEHPRPIEPPAEPAPPPPQPLKLTKKEQKKLRTQRRLVREKERQEMIRQGLIEPPKPKVKMSNLMKVLGSEATQDPTRLEREIRTSAAEREQAHVDRNIARKLTPAERKEKKERKLFDDPNTLETIVSVYRINDLSHKQTRFKVDVNAQENRLTGCAVLSDGINVVVVEGGNKSIKRYSKLMLRRINWASAVNDEEDEEDENEDKPPNKCVLVWQGSVAKPSFNRFTVHECLTEAAARKVFTDAGVGHYWDLAVNFADDQV